MKIEIKPQKTTIITRKIELWPIGTKEEINLSWNTLRNFEDKVYQNANKIISTQYSNFAFKNQATAKLNFEIKDLYRQLKKESNKKKEIENQINLKKKEIKDLQKKTTENLESLLGGSQQNSTARLISEYIGCSYISSALNDQIFSYLKKEINDVIAGKNSLRTYKKGMPIPFMKSSMRFEKNDGNVYLNWVNDLKFKLHFGKDKSNNRIIIEKCLDKTYQYCDSSIQIKDRKMFLLLVVKHNIENIELNKNLSIGVDLGINNPAVCTTSDGTFKLFIGSKNDFHDRRVKYQNIYRQKQKALTFIKGGRGRKHKMRAMDTLRDQEKNWVKTYNHTLTSQIINFALQHKASTIKLEFLEGYGKNGKNNIILRNWSYYQIQTMLLDKSKKYGINVFYIDPYHTSQTCSCCGHFEENQREGKVFKCKNIICTKFDVDIDADYNAALNISKSDKFVTEKKECEYYKKEKIIE